MKNLTLITGGVRSGKSRFAEELARAANKPVYYLATMPQLEDDAEQADRIRRHRERRPSEWKTIECPYSLPAAIAELPNANAFCLIDCLSLYVSNLLISDNFGASGAEPYAKENDIDAELDRVVQTIHSRSDIEFVVVTNEVGFGVVPDNPLSRAFRDFLGLGNQKFAAAAGNVWLTCAGLPLRLKPTTAV